MVDKAILINILDNIGVGNPLLSWLASYLTSRRQFVFINYELSDICTILSVVSHDGSLSHLLFILFLNSLSDYFDFVKVLLYSDYIKLFLKMSSPSENSSFKLTLLLSVIE